jgi:hypothetical protein
MELHQAEVMVVETDPNYRETTLENNLSLESFEEIKTSGVDNNDDDQFQIVD